MTKNYSPSNQEDMKWNIRQTIIEIMKSTDIDKITAGEVAQKAHISRSTFYRFYGSVEEAIKEMEDELLHEINNVNRLAMCEKLVKKDTEPFQSSMARTEILKNYSDFISVITSKHGDPQFSHRAIQLIRDYLMNKLKNNDSSDNLQIEFFVEFMAAGWYHLINYWIINKPEVTPEQFLEAQYQYFDTFQKLMGINDINNS